MVPRFSVERFEQLRDDVFRQHPELVDHRQEFPWLVGALGDPTARVWFVAENPSLTQVRKLGPIQTVDAQWAASAGDQLFRQALVRSGFKTSAPLEAGGWNCYITDVVKSADIVKEWRGTATALQRQVAEAWAPVLAFELEVGQPAVLVVLGRASEKLLGHLTEQDLLPPLPPLDPIFHYSYLARPESGGLRRRREHPDRIEEWMAEFDRIALRYLGPPGR